MLIWKEYEELTLRKKQLDREDVEKIENGIIPMNDILYYKVEAFYARIAEIRIKRRKQLEALIEYAKKMHGQVIECSNQKTHISWLYNTGKKDDEGFDIYRMQAFVFEDLTESELEKVMSYVK